MTTFSDLLKVDTDDQTTIGSFVTGLERKAFSTSDTAKLMESHGQNPHIAWEMDAQVEPPGEKSIDDDHILANTDAKGWNPDSGEKPSVGYTFYNASKMYYDWKHKLGDYAEQPRDFQEENAQAFANLERVQAAANPNLAEQTKAVTEFEDAEADPAAIEKKPKLTPREISQWGLDVSGWLNFGFTKLGMEYMAARDAPPEVKAAILALYQITNSPDWYRDNPMGMNWNGTIRLGKEIIADPISYLGLAQVRGLLTAGSTLAGRMGVKNPFMQRLAAGLMGKAILSGEGGALAMFQNIMVQKMRGQKAINWDEAKQAAIYGAAGTAALTTTLPIAAKGAKKAWQAIVDTADQAAREGGATSRMFVGPQSKTADKRKLEIAKEMKKVGHDREEIRKSTGWFYDKKGKWMSEVSDELAQTRFDQSDVDTLVNAGIDVISDMRIMEGDPRYIGRWFHSLGLRGPRQAGAFTLEDLKQLPALADKPEVLAAAEKVDAALKGGTLGDVFSSPEVMKAYPWLAEVPFYMDTAELGAAVSGKVKPDLRKKGGGYTMNLGRIKGPQVLGSGQILRKDESIKSVLSHEAQHIIQNYEKWSRGGSPEEFKLSKADEEEIFETLTASIAAARWIEHKEANPQMAAGPLWDMFVAIYKANMNGLEPPSAVQSLSSKHYNTFKEMEHWQREILKHSKSERSQFEAYEKLAGEAQARLTQSRMGLTAEQRAARDPLEEMTTSSGEKLTEDDLLYVNPEQHAYNPDVYASVPRPSQIDMRIRQGAFENDVRAGEITPENAKSLGHDPDEVRAILADQQKEFVARSQKAPLLKPAAEGTRAHRVPHQLLVGGTGEKATTPVTQAFNANNKQANLANIDAAHAAVPNALKSENDWVGSLQTTLGGDHLITPPRQAIKYANDPQAMADKLAQLTPDLKLGVDRGFDHVKRLRHMYHTGTATPVTTGNLFLWGILSRGAGPVQQETAFLNIFKKSQPFIQKAINGTFDEKAFTQWQKQLGRYEVSPGEFINKLPEGSPARQVTMNVNAAGKLLMALSEQAAEGGKTKLQALHEMLGNTNLSGPQIRRSFMEMMDNAGIDNKVVSFSLLVSGRDDLLVMDRIQSRHLWDDGQFAGFNVYDGYAKAGSTAKEGLHGLMRGPRGLLITEMLERGLADNVREAYRLVGRPQDASLGRFHWETWVIDGEQVVAHDTLRTVATKKAEGVGVVEGKRATFSSGFNYVQGKRGMEAQYPLSDGTTAKMTLTKSKEFEAFIKNKKNGIIPKDFQVSKSTDRPWYEQPGVDRRKLDAAARKFAK